MRTIPQPFSCSRTIASILGVFLLAPALLLAVPGTSPAAPVFTFDPSSGGTARSMVNQTVGWEFEVVEPITVTALGWLDDGGDGLEMAHEVGIWNPAGTILTSVVVPSGGRAPLDGAFRTVDLANPLVLTPGVGYVVGGENFALNPEDLVCGSSSLETPTNCGPAIDGIFDPRISFTAALFNAAARGMSQNPPLRRPDMTGTVGQGFFGPSFSVIPIPEPSTHLLLGCALLGMALRRRKWGKPL